jgi:hypothetical protein
VRLKAACWAFAALTAFLLLGWVPFVGLPPKNAPRADLRAYAVKTELYFFALIGSFIATTVFAALVVRQTRREVREEAAENLRTLIEGTLQDHRKKNEPNEQQD